MFSRSSPTTSYSIASCSLCYYYSCWLTLIGSLWMLGVQLVSLTNKSLPVWCLTRLIKYFSNCVYLIHNSCSNISNCLNNVLWSFRDFVLVGWLVCFFLFWFRIQSRSHFALNYDSIVSVVGTVFLWLSYTSIFWV